MSKVLVVGAAGMLGSDLVPELIRRGYEVAAPTIEELDITDSTSVAKVALNQYGAKWCINCAAYTAVDKAESEPMAAAEINVLGASYLGKACAMGKLKLIHISTDFVFDGSQRRPYDPDDATSPLGVYGKTKRDGEEAVREAIPTALVVRTAWLYGPNGPSFPRTMIRAHEAGKTLRVVDDQTGCPTYTSDLAKMLCQFVEQDPFPGIYHAVGPSTMTWRNFADKVLTTWTGQPVHVEPIQTADYPTPAKRPPYSVLSMDKTFEAGLQPMRSVEDALADFCARLRDQVAVGATL